MDHRCHQTQHATGALELHQRRPVRVEPVEYLRMDRIRGLQPLLVIGITTLRWELLVLRAIKIVELPCYRVPSYKLLFFDQRLEEPPPHDFETFFRAGWPP